MSKVLENSLIALASRKPAELASELPHGLGGVLDLLEHCQSPIEAILLVHLYGRVAYDTMCELIPQAPIGRYRIDLAIVECDWHENPPRVRLAIECDGHDFHERTKEQAARDKRRDRELVAAGWQVLRFTGSEIRNEAKRCADEVLSIINGLGGTL